MKALLFLWQRTAPLYTVSIKIRVICHVSPHETQNPEEFVTEVCYPVRKKK